MPIQPYTVFTWLIHGTWARQARWTQEGSPLRTALQNDVPAFVRFKLLPWTGRNRAGDREIAAEKLIDSVEKTSGGRAVRIVVAHSHGGNIGALAARDRPDLFDAVITLNTPFIAPVPRDWSVLVVHLLVLMLGVGVLVNWTLHLNYLVEAAIAIGVTAAVLGPFFLFRDRLISAAQRVLHDTILSDTYGEQTPVLCISTADDEAFGWLEVIDALINIPFLLLHRIAFPVVFVLMVAFHYFFRWEFATNTLELFSIWAQAAAQSTSLGDFASRYFFSTPLVLSDENIKSATSYLYNEAPLGLALWLGLLSSFFYFTASFAILASASLLGSVLLRRVVFGARLGPSAFLYALATRLKVTLTPVYLRRAELLFVQSSESRWLRHSDPYANPDVLRLITGWVTSLLVERTQAEAREE
jgi:pimeloyl-ACP methyl ester carboxylesterase